MSAGGMPKYWMVKGSGATSQVHETYASAFQEAERLAKYNPLVVFAVLEVRCFITGKLRQALDGNEAPVYYR